MARRLIVSLAAAAALTLAGCGTIGLDKHVGGEPALLCKARDGTAVLDDKLAGGAQWHLSVNRRFRDGDMMCSLLMQADLNKAELGKAMMDSGVRIIVPADEAPPKAIDKPL